MRHRRHTQRAGVSTIATVAFVGSLVWIGCISAADMIFRGSDGSQGSITHLGDDQAIYRDAHGTTGPIQRPGGQGSPMIITPQGEVMSGTVTPFGSPMPPNYLTPAPVLPLNPHLGPTPAPAARPPVPLTSSPPQPFGDRR